jgi:hypothetical protein
MLSKIDFDIHFYLLTTETRRAQREQRDIFDFRFKVVDLNKSALRKLPNLQSTINNLILHHSVPLW